MDGTVRGERTGAFFKTGAINRSATLPAFNLYGVDAVFATVRNHRAW
jgi:hypothetical protein